MLERLLEGGKRGVVSGVCVFVKGKGNGLGRGEGGGDYQTCALWGAGYQ